MVRGTTVRTSSSPWSALWSEPGRQTEGRDGQASGLLFARRRMLRRTRLGLAALQPAAALAEVPAEPIAPPAAGRPARPVSRSVAETRRHRGPALVHPPFS